MKKQGQSSMKPALKSSRPLVHCSNKGHRLNTFLENKVTKKLTTKNILLQLKLFQLLRASGVGRSQTEKKSRHKLKCFAINRLQTDYYITEICSVLALLYCQKILSVIFKDKVSQNFINHQQIH